MPFFIYIPNEIFNNFVQTISSVSKKKRNKVGLSPGSIIYTGKFSNTNACIRITKYSQDHLNEIDLAEFRIDALLPIPNGNLWIDVQGLDQVNLITSIGNEFGLHPILIENIVDVEQRPKFEEYDNYLCLIFDTLTLNEETYSIQNLQNAIILGQDFLISFQEGHDDSFRTVRERMRNTIGKTRSKGSDYLAYALVDAQVDGYYLVMDRLEEEVETLEKNIETSNETDIRQKILHLKKELIKIRRSIQPLREALGKMSRTDSAYIEASTSIFLKDVFDHLVYLMELTENLKDMLSSIYDLYIAQISMRMNNVMKALTIISSIFIPLSFIASVYGMNFDNMPELRNPHGYFYVLGIMFIILLGMIGYFKKRGWMD